MDGRQEKRETPLNRGLGTRAAGSYFFLPLQPATDNLAIVGLALGDAGGMTSILRSPFCERLNELLKDLAAAASKTSKRRGTKRLKL